MSFANTGVTVLNGYGFLDIFSYFAADDDRVMKRLDDLQKSVPAQLPPAHTLFRKMT